MKLTVRSVGAVALLCSVGAGSPVLAAGKTGVQSGGLSCGFTVAKNASPAARCAAIRHQCGGKFYAVACGDKLLSAI